MYAKSREQLHKRLDMTIRFSSEICMEFGLDKCKSVHLLKGKIVTSEGYDVTPENTIKDLDFPDQYKYLGIEQLKGIDHMHVKKNLKQSLLQRIRSILKTQLYSRNKIRAINTYAIPVLTYSFGIIKWSLTDLEDISRMIRTQLTEHRMRHPKAAIERVTLPVSMRGMGVTDIARPHSRHIDSLRQYFYRKRASLNMLRVICKADVNATPLHLGNTNFTMQCKSIENQKADWKSKALHGAYANELENEDVDQESTHLWIRKGNVFGKTTGFMMAIQERFYQQEIIESMSRKKQTYMINVENVKFLQKPWNI